MFAAQVHGSARQDGVFVGGDVNVDGIGTVYFLIAQLAVVYFLDALCVGIDGGFVSFACFCPSAALCGNGCELGMAATGLVVIDADVVGTFVCSVDAEIFAAFLVF